MRRLVLALVLLLAAVSAEAQDAQAFGKIYLGAAPCTLSTGSGAPSSGATCDLYLDSSTGELYTKHAGSWTLVVRAEDASTFSGNNTFSGTNTFTGTEQFISSAQPTLWWQETDQGANLRNWRWVVGTGVFDLQIMNDDLVTGSTAFNVDRMSNANFYGTLGVLGDFKVNTNKFTVAAASGNTAVAGTLGITGDTAFGANAGTSSYVCADNRVAHDTTGAADFRYLFTNEFRALIFTAEQESVLAGAERITKSYSTISQTFTCPALSGTSTLWVFDSKTFSDAAIFVSGDQVIIHALTRSALGGFSISDCVGAVTSYADGTGGNDGQQSWTFTRNASSAGGGMSAGPTVAVNQLVQDMGVSGNGYVESVADDGSNNVNAPYVQTVTWATAPITANLTTRCRFGNLKGITSVGEYGLLCGNFSGNAYVRLSDTNAEIKGIPLSLLDSSTVTIKLDPSVPSFALGNALPSAFGTGTGVWMGKDSGVYKFRAGVPGGNILSFDGTNILIKSANAVLDNSGLTLGQTGTIVIYQSTSALKFLHAAGATFGQTGDIYGLYNLSDGGAGSEQLILQNRIIGTSASGINGRAITTIDAQGFNIAGGGTNAPDVFITLRSDPSVDLISMQATNTTISGALQLGWRLRAAGGDGTTYNQDNGQFFSTSGNFGEAMGIVGSSSGLDINLYTYGNAERKVVIQAVNGAGVGGEFGVYVLNTVGGLVRAIHTDATEVTEFAGDIIPLGYRGRQGTGGTLSNDFNLYWNGSCFELYVDGSHVGTCVQTASDARVKKNIAPLSSALAEVMKLQPVTFNWRNPKETTVKQYGVIAQDIEKVFPTLVQHTTMKTEWTPDGLITMNYEGLVPILVRAVQELQAEIDQLKKDKAK